MAHGDAWERKWRGNWRMEWVESSLHNGLEHCVSSITTNHKSWCAHFGCQQSTQLTPRPPGRFKWTRPFRAKDEIRFLRMWRHVSNASLHRSDDTNRKPHFTPPYSPAALPANPPLLVSGVLNEHSTPTNYTACMEQVWSSFIISTVTQRINAKVTHETKIKKNDKYEQFMYVHDTVVGTECRLTLSFNGQVCQLPVLHFGWIPSWLIEYTDTHTYTHTHIYIYIYIYETEGCII